MKHLILLIFSVLPAAAQDVPIFTWSPTGRLADARSSACVAALQDGRGLVAGGEGADGTLASVELYGLDGQFTPVAAMNFARSRHTCTTLNDGRVLAAGGGAPAEIYDPAANAWTVLDTPGLARRGSTATLRPDGTVAIVGGSNGDAASAVVEIFDPTTNLISALNTTLASARQGHAAALLPDGSVLIAGGENDSGVLANTEILGPDGSITAGPDLPEPRVYLSATPLPDGRVLIAGGSDGQNDLATAYLFSPADSTLLSAAPLTVARSRHVALALPGNGSILIAGGDSLGAPTASTEVFDLGTETFLPAGDLTIARRDISAAALNQPGVVLSAGGITDSGPLNSCGVFVAPAISFDKNAYSAGDTFRITGAHWAPGGVKAEVTFVNLRGATTAGVSTGLAADATGSFQFVASSALTEASEGSNITAKFTSGSLSATAKSLQTDPTTTAVTLSATTATAGQAVTITADVRDSLGLVTALPGSVNFTLDGLPLGSASNQTFDLAANHQFTFTTPGMKGGTHTIQAVYASNSAMFPSSSGAAQLPVSRVGTTLLLEATHTAAIGDTIQVSIVVKPAANVSLLAPTGVVQLQINGVTHNLTLMPNNLAQSSTAQFSFPAREVGTINYQASYLGDDNYNNVGPFFNNSIVSRAKVTMTLTPAKSAYSLGDDIVVTVKVKGNAVNPTGTIQALQSLVQTSVPLGFASTDTSTAQIEFGYLGVGSWTLFVHYSGDSSFDAADGEVSFQVSKATPAIVMNVQNVTTLNTTYYAAGIKVADPRYASVASRLPGGTISVFYNGSSTAAHVFTLHQSVIPQIMEFSYGTPDSIFALIGTTFPIRFVYSGDSNYNSAQATCQAKVDLIADPGHISCNTYPQ